MKRLGLLTCVSFTAITLASASVSAADLASVSAGYKPYVSVFGGASLLNSFTVGGINTYTLNPKVGYILGAAVGVKWNDVLRTELELSHSVWAIDHATPTYDGASGNINATYLLGNVWADLPTQSAFTPYVGGGLGVGWANADVTIGGHEGLINGNSSLAFQIGAGVKFAASDKVDIDIGYRFKDLTNVVFTDRDNPVNFAPVALTSHNFQIGLTVHLD
jgi:opacity protein-like surface antigen